MPSPRSSPPGGPTGELDVQGDSDVLTLPTGSADVALAPVVADASVTGARAAGVSGGLAGDVTESLSAPGSPATALPLAQPAYVSQTHAHHVAGHASRLFQRAIPRTARNIYRQERDPMAFGIVDDRRRRIKAHRLRIE